ncbi:ArnT family glycosyltransferase [Povalibacter sp.]|uniref:ArnT family glycosyltransferase n=1 Tax=Povalibacter sp. TaxID=1962978 RepID=UPI002F40CCE6
MKTGLVVFLILTAGAAIRLYGIDFGLPFLYDVDEPVFVNRAFHLLAHKTLDPGWFGHPGSVTIYCLALLFAIYSAVGVAVGHFADFAAVETIARLDPAEFYLAGRLMIAAFGLGVIYLTFELTQKILHRGAGYIASLLVAMAPLAIELSRLIRTDIQVTFFLLLILFFCLRIVERGLLRDYIGAGLALGFAVATKYPAVIGCLPIVVASIRPNGNDGRFRDIAIRPLLIAGAAAVVGTFIASPFLFIDIDTVLRDLGKEARTEHLSATSEGFWSSLFWYVTDVSRRNFTIIGLLLAIVGVIGLLRSGRKSGVLLLLSFVVPFLLFISSLNLRWERWLMPAIPVIAMFCAIGVALTWYAIQRLPLLMVRRAVQVLFAVVLLASGSTLIHADYLRASELSRGDTRTQAGNWILANIPDGSVLMMERGTPQLPRGKYVLLCEQDRHVEDFGSLGVSNAKYQRVNGVIGQLGSVEEMLNSAAQYVVISNEYDRRLAEGEKFSADLLIYDYLFKQASLVHVSVPVQGRLAGPPIRVFKIK